MPRRIPPSANRADLGEKQTATPFPQARGLLLVERGLFESRARAQAAIEAGLVIADDKPV